MPINSYPAKISLGSKGDETQLSSVRSFISYQYFTRYSLTSGKGNCSLQGSTVKSWKMWTPTDEIFHSWLCWNPKCLDLGTSQEKTIWDLVVHKVIDLAYLRVFLLRVSTFKEWTGKWYSRKDFPRNHFPFWEYVVYKMEFLEPLEGIRIHTRGSTQLVLGKAKGLKLLNEDLLI